jgi:pyruvate formate lyase activating enzyme
MASESSRDLQSILSEHVGPAAAELRDLREGGVVQCHACAHACVIPSGKSGICRVRLNKEGRLHVPHGYVEGLAVDPIEKKPFYHVMPGSTALSFGMLGCNFHCQFCQNWYTAQVLREPGQTAQIRPMPAQTLVDLAIREQCSAIISTYNEPLITTEWAVEVFALAQPRKFHCGYVSNGFATPRVLRYLRPHADLYKIDLKAFRDQSYRTLGGRLQPVLDSIALARELGFWVEVVTLIVPEFNDSDEELRQMAKFLVGVSADIPWHVTAFHPMYKMTDRPRTPAESLRRALEIGRSEGLHFVYAGNLPGLVDGAENTHCPKCRSLLVERLGYHVVQNRVSETGKCPACDVAIPGVWS